MDAQDAAARAQDPKLHGAIASYLQTNWDAYDALIKFIKHRRQNQPPEAPLDKEEYDLRSKYIRGIIEKQRKIRGNEDWMVSEIQLAYLLRLDCSKLEEFSIACGKHSFLPCQGQPILDSWGALTRHFFQTDEFDDRAGFEPPYEEPYTPGTGDICSKLDNSRCVITGDPLSLVVCIVPASWNNTNKNLKYTKSLTSALSVIIDNPAGEEPLEHLKSLHERKDSLFKSWNAICISRDLYQLWKLALPDDSSKSRITLQFHRLYPRNSPCEPEATLQDDDETSSPEPTLESDEDSHPSPDPLYVSVRDNKSGQLVQCGDIFTIIRFTEDIDKCKQMFDIQWEISNAACDSGFTSGANIDDEVEWDLDAEESPSEDEEWVMAEESPCFYETLDETVW